MDFKALRLRALQLEEDITILRKRKSALKIHGQNTKEIATLIKDKQIELSKAKHILNRRFRQALIRTR